MVACEKCGSENRKGAEFCSSCGIKLGKPENYIFTLAFKFLNYIFGIIIIYLLLSQALKLDKNGRISGAAFFAFCGMLFVLLSFWPAFVELVHDLQMSFRKKGRTVEDMKKEIRRSGFTGFGFSIVYLILAYFVH